MPYASSTIKEEVLNKHNMNKGNIDNCCETFALLLLSGCNSSNLGGGFKSHPCHQIFESNDMPRS